jgi:hypothetical protein
MLLAVNCRNRTCSEGRRSVGAEGTTAASRSASVRVSVAKRQRGVAGALVPSHAFVVPQLVPLGIPRNVIRRDRA